MFFVFLAYSLPFVEVFPVGGYGAYSASPSIAENDEGVVLEELRDVVLVVSEVVVVCFLEVPVGCLQLYEYERKSINESDEVRPSCVEVA